MIWSDYLGIEQRLLKRACIWTGERMGVRTSDRSTRTIIFDRGVHKYVRVIEIMTFDQVYVTDFNCNLPLLRVGLMQVTIPDFSITFTL